MKKLTSFLLLSVLLLSLTACGGQTGGETSYTVTLEGNPTTGYEWSQASCDDALLVRELEYTEGEHEDGMVGVGGVYTCTVTAKKDTKPGEYHLSFTYCQPWDAMNTLAQIANVTIKVDKEGHLTGKTDVMDCSEDIALSQAQAGAIIENQPEENNCYAPDGALLYTAHYSKPVVTILDNPEAETAINAWFESAKNDFFASLTAYDAKAADACDLWQEKGKGEWNHGITKDRGNSADSDYYVTVTCTPTLNNDSYLSFRIDKTAFFYGDEKESVTTTGVTFARNSNGGVYTLSDLYGEGGVQHIQEQTGIVAEGNWFLTEEGLVVLDETGKETAIPHEELEEYLPQ